MNERPPDGYLVSNGTESYVCPTRQAAERRAHELGPTAVIRETWLNEWYELPESRRL